MQEKNEDLPIDMPIYEEDLAKMQVEPQRFNRVQENLIYLLNKKKVSLSDVCRETMIPLTTIYCWWRGHTKTQMADLNLIELARYFEVTLEWLICNEEYDDELKK